MCHGLGFTHSEYLEIRKALNAEEVSVRMKYPYSSKVMLKAKIRGTTFTGHPTRTTFGNTLRMRAYVSLIIKKLAYKTKILKWHAGDDVLIYMSRRFVNEFSAILLGMCY